MMTEQNQNAMLLRIFMGESDQWQHQALYDALAVEARKQDLSGITVLRGILGYGARRIFHASHLIDLSEDLPIVIEIVDTEENIQSFLPTIDKMVHGKSLVTLEKVQIYKPKAPN